MKQVEEQYNNRRYRIHCLHRDKKPRPTHVSPEDWAWLIKHVWSNEDFQRNRETGEWPTAMLVWRATYQKADGTWSVPNGAEVLAELNEVAQSQHENISSASVPLVEHFALVLGRKVNHSRGVGFRAINGVAKERLRFLAQVDAAEKHAAAAQERADAAEQRAVAMEDQVRKLDEANARLEEEQQSQREELNSQKKTVEGQVTDVERMVQLKPDEQMARYFSRLASSNGVPFSQASSDAANNQV
uniref:Uncharacterized protein n=1 Tax=Leersia perrieri TaxID=77586 RepID=A0A0D9XRB9_9ORYZ